MTKDDACVAIASVTRLTKDDVNDFLSPDLTDADRQLLIQTYKDTGWMPSASAWDVVLGILTGCAAVAALVIPITGAISGVYSLKSM